MKGAINMNNIEIRMKGIIREYYAKLGHSKEQIPKKIPTSKIEQKRNRKFKTIPNKQTELKILNFPTRKNPGSHGYTAEFH